MSDDAYKAGRDIAVKISRSEKRSAFRHGSARRPSRLNENVGWRLAALSDLRTFGCKRQENVDLSRFYVKTGVGFL